MRGLARTIAAALVIAFTSCSSHHEHTKAPRETTSTTITQPARLDLVDFVSPSTGYALFIVRRGDTCTYTVARSVDGGHTFTPASSQLAPSGCDETYGTRGLAFDDAGNGVLFSSGLLVSHDEGHSWTKETLGPDERIVTAVAVGSSIWLIETNPPRVRQSTDGGRTFTDTPGQPSGLSERSSLVRTTRSVAFLLTPSADDFGPSHLWLTTNAGATWSERKSPCSHEETSLAIAVAPEGTTWAACAGEPSAGQQLKATYESRNQAASWESRAQCGPSVPPACTVPSSGYLDEIAAVSSTRAFLVGGRSSLARTDDGGRRWSVVEPLLGGTDGGTGPIQFVDGRHGFLVVEDANNNEVPTLYVTTDGGDHWNLAASGLST